MEYIVTKNQMKALDTYTIEEIGIPSMVLMERAALSVFEAMKKEAFPLQKVLVLCGSGNNGADGVVIARLLFLSGYRVSVCVLGNPEHFTEEMKQQTAIAGKYGISFVNTFQAAEYTTIVDAAFGVGLSREVSGKYRESIEKINECSAKVVAVDIPSGICADTGKVLGCGVKADLTVTFAYKKAGLCLYPGAAYAGKVITADMGIYVPQHEKIRCPDIKACTEEELARLQRKRDGNKGTFGKILLLAGSRDIFGAAYLSGSAAMHTGAGMLKICTREENRQLFAAFPEAMLLTYDDSTAKPEFLSDSLEWADVIGIGPGLGTSVQAEKLLEYVLTHTRKPLVIDADGLNLLQNHKPLLKAYPGDVILTPHLGEFSRLSGKSIQEWKENPIEVTEKTAKEFSAILVCKDARTVTAIPGGSIYVNLSGNDGMATAGSGDVLTGMILGLLAQGKPAGEAAYLGVYLHGKAGDRAAEKKGRAFMLAGDIIDAAGEILRELSRKEGKTHENTEQNPCRY